MRRWLCFAVLTSTPLLAATAASAERAGNDTRGARRLGRVSHGIGQATGATEQTGAGSRAIRDPRVRDGELYRRERRACRRRESMPRDFGRNPPPRLACTDYYVAVVANDGTVVREYVPDPAVSAGSANVDVFIGAHKLIDSDGALALALAVDDRWLRLAGSLVRYQEQQMDGSQLTLTVPTLTAGVRLGHGGQTHAFLEGGFAIASTHNDPVADSSVTGAIAGVHLERWLAPSGRRALIGDVHAMYFESDVRAYATRLGMRIGFMEVAVRVLDFNVGPALYGPELGLRF